MKPIFVLILTLFAGMAHADVSYHEMRGMFRGRLLLRDYFKMDQAAKEENANVRCISYGPNGTGFIFSYYVHAFSAEGAVYRVNEKMEREFGGDNTIDFVHRNYEVICETDPVPVS